MEGRKEPDSRSSLMELPNDEARMEGERAMDKDDRCCRRDMGLGEIEGSGRDDDTSSDIVQRLVGVLIRRSCKIRRTRNR